MTLLSGRATMTTVEKITSTKAAVSTPFTGNPEMTTVKKHEMAATTAAPEVPRTTSVKREPVQRRRVSRFRAGVSTSTVATISCTKLRSNR